MATQPVHPTPWLWIPQHLAEGASEVRDANGDLVCTTSSDDTAQFIAEASATFHVTGLTPIGLLALVNKHRADGQVYIEQRNSLLTAAKRIAASMIEHGTEDNDPKAWDALQDAIARAEGGAQ